MQESTINVTEAKRHLSGLLDRVVHNQEVITITRHGKPIAQLGPIQITEKKSHIVCAQGWLEEDDDFFVIIEEIVAERQLHLPRSLQEKRK
jgi:prevent-host-death family protein